MSVFFKMSFLNSKKVTGFWVKKLNQNGGSKPHLEGICCFYVFFIFKKSSLNGQNCSISALKIFL